MLTEIQRLLFLGFFCVMHRLINDKCDVIDRHGIASKALSPLCKAIICPDGK